MDENKTREHWMIEVPADGMREGGECVRTQSGHYRIESILLAVDLDLYDVIEAESVENSLIMRRVISKSGWSTKFYALTERARDSTGLLEVLRRVEQSGGRSNYVGGQVLGGMLAVAVPPNCKYDPDEDIRRL